MMNNPVYHKPHTDATSVVFVGGKFGGRVMTVGQVKNLPELRGYVSDMKEERGRGYCVHYPIFDNAPKVEGYAGPMAGGSETPLRYESWKVYESMSV